MHDAVSVEHNKMRDIRQLWGKETASWKANPIQHFTIVEAQNTGINVSEQCTIDGFSSSVGRAFWTAWSLIIKRKCAFSRQATEYRVKLLPRKKIFVYTTLYQLPINTILFIYYPSIPPFSLLFFSQCHPRRPYLRSPARPPLPTLSWAKPAPAAAWI